MANVVRLVNGGQIQVRTGVLAGVGPTGPPGPAGPQGVDGPQGPQGEVGAQGAIAQISARANVSGTTTLTASTEANIAFGTVAYDDMSVCTSSVNFTLPEAGDYLIQAYVEFAEPANPGNGTRRLKVVSSEFGTVWVNSCPANEDGSTFLDISCVYRADDGGDLINLKGYTEDDLSVGVTSGAIVITRVGSGPVGAVGATGPQGLVGPAGPEGPQGPDGDAGSGFATYGDLQA